MTPRTNSPAFDSRARAPHGAGWRWRRALLPSLLAGMFALAGCAPMNALRSKMLKPSVAVAPPAAPAPATVPEPTVGATTLGAIVNGELQHGRYLEGERDLRHYLAQHPDDRAAQALLQQLTADPKQVLGAASREYVVQPGESYSTLAARWLGDANRFVILARYNGSTDPSVLHAGQTLRLPLSAHAGTTNAPESAAAAAPAPTEAAVVKARRLQAESLALLAQGQQPQALVRMDEALAADPHLPPSGSAQDASLRSQLVASYHQRAIVLYRDQQLDEAIALWDRVLAIDPGFEPATVYRTRALELKHRLKQY
jgi:tetratricopeptide (TPR) repeat protein